MSGNYYDYRDENNMNYQQQSYQNENELKYKLEGIDYTEEEPSKNENKPIYRGPSISEEIISDVVEIKQIVTELKNLSMQQKQLREQKTKLESKIMDYLKQTDLPGIKYQGITILAEEKKRNKRKKKKEKDTDCLTTLQGMGINNAQEVYDAVLKSMKGEEEIITKIKCVDKKV